MKKTLFSLAALAALLLGVSACDDSEMQTSSSKQQLFPAAEMGNISVGVTTGQPVTKAATASDNDKVNHIQLFVFDQSGSLIASKGKAFGTPAAATSGSDTVQITVPLGISGMKVYALANSSAESTQWTSVKDTTTLRACISKLSSNSIDCMAAIGSASGLTFTKGQTVSIPVKRFGCKVILDKVTTAFTSAAHQTLDFKMSEIFLTNVQPECPYSQVASNAAAAGWYNQRGYVSSGVNSLVAETGLNVDLKGGSSDKHYFYCYPNTTVKNDDTHDTASAFTARRTRLVLKTTLGSNTYYYPIDLPGSDAGKLESNKTYTVTDLKITGIGVQNPEDKLEKGVISCKITILAWETGESWTVEY